MIFISLFKIDEDFSLDHELKITEDEPTISENLVATLRLIVMSKEELEQYNLSNIDDLLSTMVNLDNERRALNKLSMLLNGFKEMTFTTTLEENLNRIQSNELNDNERYSLIYLIGQKQIIEHASRWIDKAIVELK